MKVHKNKPAGIGAYDFVKGTAVLWIIIEHTLEMHFHFESGPMVQNVLIFLHNAMIPVFLIVSGFGYRTVNIGKKIKKQTEYYLRPYLFTGAAKIVLAALMFPLAYPFMTAVKKIIQLIGGVLLGASAEIYLPGGLHIAAGVGTVWYLLSLFEMWLLLNLLARRLDGKKLFIAVLIVSAVGTAAGYFWKQVPYCLLPSAAGLILYYAGWQIKQKKLMEGRTALLLWGLAVILSLVSVRIGRFNLATCEWKYGPVDVIAAGGAGLFLVLAAQELVSISRRLTLPFSWLGRNSLELLCIHTVEMHGIPWQALFDRLKLNSIAEFALALILKGIVIAAGYLLVRKLKKHLKARKRNKK